MRIYLLLIVALFGLAGCKKSSVNSSAFNTGTYVSYREVDSLHNEGGNRGLDNVKFISMVRDTTYIYSYYAPTIMQTSAGTLPSISMVVFTSGTTGYFSTGGVNTPFTYSIGQYAVMFQENSGRFGYFTPQSNGTLSVFFYGGL